MEILRYALTAEETGNEQRIISLLRSIGLQRDDMHIDCTRSEPNIIIQSYTKEMSDLIRTIARISNLRRVPAPEPMNPNV